MATLYEAIGADEHEARRRAVIAVSAYLGHLQLARGAPASLPTSDESWQQHLDTLEAMLIDSM